MKDLVRYKGGIIAMDGQCFTYYSNHSVGCERRERHALAHGCNFRGLDILMPKLLPHCADIRPRFEQMRGERMPQCMAGYLFFKATGPGSSFQCPIYPFS
jgi:hypothetical protein